MNVEHDITLSEYQALAEFRYQLRCFLRFSEQAARTVGLEPQQHQLLLALKGLPEGRIATVGELAERLQIQFVLESRHLPVEYGKLQYDRVSQCWASEHSDSRIQRLADCFLQAYLERNTP